MVFISHATPEDNALSKWLALRLASQGYPVWCDLTKLLGGEDFWKDIESAIRDRTIKFLFVLSKVSNQKSGTLMELAVARKVGKSITDFIIPLRIDDIKSDDVNIELNRLNYIDFSRNWLGGLQQLLKKLAEDNVPKDPRFTPTAVTEWWKQSHSAMEGVETKPERYCSNWFEFKSVPPTLRLHSIEPQKQFEDSKITFGLPTYLFDRYLLTFATAPELQPRLEEYGLTIANTVDLELAAFQTAGMEHPKIERREARNIITALFKEGFDFFAASKGLLPYQLANHSLLHWFRKDLVDRDRVFYRDLNGKRGWKGVSGYKEFSSLVGPTRIRNWHFGVQARVYAWPFFGYAIKPHVVFTENGVLYESKTKQHAARRSQCKSWYNNDWLDRIMATMSFLSGEETSVITVPLSLDSVITVSKTPLLFESPVSYQIVAEQPDLENIENDELDEVGTLEEEEL